MYISKPTLTWTVLTSCPQLSQTIPAVLVLFVNQFIFSILYNTIVHIYIYPVDAVGGGQRMVVNIVAAGGHRCIGGGGRHVVVVALVSLLVMHGRCHH